MRFKYADYSEEQYINRIQLKNIYTGSIADLIYEEILQYRLLFRHPLMFTVRNYYLTYNKTLFMKMMKVYEVDNQIFHPSISGYTKRNLVTCIHDYEYKNKVVINDCLKSFLLGNEDFLIKFYVLLFFVKDKRLCEMFIIIHDKEHWKMFLDMNTFHNNENNEVLDLTYSFRSFLDDITFYLLDYKDKYKESKTIQKENLFLLFPKLSKNQIKFYLSHSDENNFYTIYHYMDFSNQSYEGSRLAMERLCEEGFYQKRKIGKKYCYTPILTVLE